MKRSREGTGHRQSVASGGSAHLSRAALEAAVRTTEPRAFLVRPRILRRVITQDRQLAGLALRLPHRKCYVIGRDNLLALADPDELGAQPGQSLPDTILLLPQPSEAWLEAAPAEEVLLHCWRLLFHARIHAELEERRKSGRLSAAAVRTRVRRIGPTEFDEIRLVLAQEAFLLPPRDEVSTYIEFVAVYWELRCFARALLPRYFPGIEDFGALESVLGEDLDAAQLLEATRLPGAPDALTWSGRAKPAEQSLKRAAPDAPVARSPSASPSDSTYRRLVRRAQEAAGVGNLVRSAIYRARAEQAAPSGLAAKARNALKRDVDRLVRRLQVALSIQRDPEPWQESLLALARQAPRGIWTAEARLLYDLQKVCIDHEREAYEVDLLGWAVSLGSRPIQRPLPAQRIVAMSKHLRSAARRVPAVALPEAGRQQLSALLETATHHAETRLREQFRPMIARALDESALRPRNLPEQVAWHKLVEELLDRVVEHGYLTMGDLRDAISRSNLKLADFSWREDTWRGDPLLRADQRLASTLDGVHRRGEFYLRWMQRLTSLAFGTRPGRLVTRYLAVPFGGTYLGVAFLDHLAEKIAGAGPATAPSHTWAVLRILLLGTFLAAIINVPRFRRGVWRVSVDACCGVRDAAVGLARWVSRLQWLQRVLRSRTVEIGYRFLLKPLVITAAAWVSLLPRAAGWNSAPFAAGLFVAVNLFLNSRLGRDVEELIVDWTAQAWRRLGVPILTGLFYLVVDVFRAVLENVERLLYTVDEWLQFRTGETRLTFASKAVLGTLWFCVTYVLRFCINLLIEPQINPIKHFPVVTVSHKLLLPFIPAFGAFLSQTMEKELAYTVATAIITGIPGIFGFLVWELKESWRLYAANRPWELKPALVGHHGETVTRLLRPGFHSGTVPKLFAKLRRAERRAMASGDRRAALKQLRAVHHVQLAARRFVERELSDLLRHSRSWQAGAIVPGPIHLATNRMRIALSCPTVSDRPAELTLEMRSGWLVAGVSRPGWMADLSPADRGLLETALAGLYKFSGVQLVREQVESHVPHDALWDITGEGLAIIPQGDPDSEVAYDLHPEQPVAARVVRGQPWKVWPRIDPTRAVFSRMPLAWNRWVAYWQQDGGVRGMQAKPVVLVPLLPQGHGRGSDAEPVGVLEPAD